MNLERLRWLRLKLSRLFRRSHQEAALDTELQFHFDQLVAECRASGLSEREARLAAQREFGAVDAYREEARDTWRPPALADLGRSVRFAFRSLARSPGFSLIAIATLALGIGANTAMFSLLNSVVLKPLPYPESEQLDRIDRATPQNPEGRISAADFLDLQQEASRYSEIAAYALGDTSLSEPGRPAEVTRAIRVTANFFSTLRVQPQLGRDFRSDEDVQGRDRVVIIGPRCWQNRFGGAPDVIGRTIRVDGEPHEIVGVLPNLINDWRHLGAIDLFRPLALDQEQTADRRSTILRIIARRGPELSREEAAAFVAHFGARLAADHPELNGGSTWRTVPLNDTAGGGATASMLTMLIGLSGFVLVIACSNLANLLLARTIARAREFAVRAALGASRGQLLRPLIIEALLLALAGGACAIIVALWVSDWLGVRSTGENGERVIVTLDWRVMGWALAASLGTALGFGLAPALFALRLNPNNTLKSGGRGATASRGHQRLRQVLIVAQFALAMVLLAGAALFLRGFAELNDRRAGWESDHLITGTVVLPAGSYPNAERINAFHRVALERIEALNGVESASLCTFTPFFDWSDVRKFLIEGHELPEPGREPAAMVNRVSPRYFETVGTRMLAGRPFDERDAPDAPPVFIINQSMATAVFGAESPIGRRLARAGAHPQWGEIVGVVADVKSVLPDPVPVVFQLYQPIAQEPGLGQVIAVRTAGVAPSTMIDSIRAAMTQLDPDLPVHNLQPADVAVHRANSQFGVLRELLSAFAVLGLALASLGIYGVIARMMAQRTNEFAIRLALGACVRDITRLVLGSGVKLALMGAILGLFGAMGVTQLIVANFPEIHLNSPLVMLGTVLLLVSVALLACWLPARRAARVNPSDALRAE
jgi:putative ABC transport system permease protein